MRLGITLEDDQGLEGNVSAHFGQCGHFLIVDIDNNEIKDSRIVANTASHGGGGCVAVDEILKYDITHVISGGMGMGAQNKFSQANVKVFGCTGNVKKAIDRFINESLGSLGACTEHGDCH